MVTSHHIPLHVFAIRTCHLYRIPALFTCHLYHMNLYSVDPFIFERAPYRQLRPEASPGINMKQNDTKCYILHNILGSMRGGCVIEH